MYAWVYLNKCAALQLESAVPVLHLQSPYTIQSPYNAPVAPRTLWVSEDLHSLSFNHIGSVADEFKDLMTLSPPHQSQYLLPISTVATTTAA